MEIINITFNKSSEYLQKLEQQGKNDTLQTKNEMIKEAIEGIYFKSEEEKKSYEQKIDRKIKDGAKLSQSEMNYIRRTNPTMYMRILRVQMQRENLGNKLKRCKSKKEVQNVYCQAMSSISKEDPDKTALVSAYNNVTNEFKKSKEYKALPRVIKKEEEKTKNEKNQKQKAFIMEEIIDYSVDYVQIDNFDLSV